MSNFDEILNQGKKKEADVQTATSTDKKDKKEWADEQKRKISEWYNEVIKGEGDVDLYEKYYKKFVFTKKEEE